MESRGSSLVHLEFDRDNNNSARSSGGAARWLLPLNAAARVENAALKGDKTWRISFYLQKQTTLFQTKPDIKTACSTGKRGILNLILRGGKFEVWNKFGQLENMLLLLQPL